MSDSDTFLDDILRGVIDSDAPTSGSEQSSPPTDQGTRTQPDASKEPPAAADTDSSEQVNETAPALTGLDALLEGMPSLSESNSGQTLAEGAQPQAADDSQQESVLNRSADAVSNDPGNGAVAEDTGSATPPTPEAEAAAPSPNLPVAAPHDILGLPGEPVVAASHIELATEINQVAVSEPAVAEASSFGDPQSFASIAREIAATVEVEPRALRSGSSAKDSVEADRSSVYLRTRGRRRTRVNHTTRVTVIQVFAIVLLLVVGLAAEYEYVARGHANSTSTSVPIAQTLPSTHLRVVAPTLEKGFLFHFATSGSAQSAAFRVTAPFSVAVSARCSAATKSPSVDVVLQSHGRQAANLFVAGRAPGTHEVKSATLPPGTYLVIAHATGACSWSAAGTARP